MLARQRYSRFLSINHPQFCPPTCSLVYLSIISYPANVVPLRPSLASLAEQVQLHSLQSMLLVLEPVWCGYILIESTTKLWLKTNTLSHSIYLRPETVLLSLSLSLFLSFSLSLFSLIYKDCLGDIFRCEHISVESALYCDIYKLGDKIKVVDPYPVSP